jgi:hypothetical protein
MLVLRGRLLKNLLISASLLSLPLSSTRLGQAFSGHPKTRSAAKVTVTSATYRGWPGAFILSNGKAEALVVPAIGRVMQFHFVGEEGTFWENRAMDGKSPDPASTEWGNFGGDKTWPAPQADWKKMIGREWPPPAAFDSRPLQGRAEGQVVELVSPVDAAYGIRTRRRVELDSRRPVLTITTTYEKVQGSPVKVGIGVITQLRDPQRAFMALPAKSQFPQGYVRLQFDPPHDLTVEDGLVSLTRGNTQSQIGSDASTLLWMDDKYVLRIDSPRVPGAEYADEGSSAIIYTSRDPLAYVELETFGPLSTMKVGDKIQRTNTYTLSRRTEKDPGVEAKKVLGRPGHARGVKF